MPFLHSDSMIPSRDRHELEKCQLVWFHGSLEFTNNETPIYMNVTMKRTILLQKFGPPMAALLRLVVREATVTGSGKPWGAMHTNGHELLRAK